MSMPISAGLVLVERALVNPLKDSPLQCCRASSCAAPFNICAPSSKAVSNGLLQPSPAADPLEQRLCVSSSGSATSPCRAQSLECDTRPPAAWPCRLCPPPAYIHSWRASARAGKKRGQAARPDLPAPARVRRQMMARTGRR
eukprot:scaffold8028_cov444-Prasinococcus_capsulatus_cf.AAC.1